VREIVDELCNKFSSYSKVIEDLKIDETLAEPVRKVILQIANAQLWEDEEKAE
jgi:hypothetical protein